MTRQSLQTVVDDDRNLLGQRLGRKGRDTRERILTATQTLLEREPEGSISLSAVAREASIGMTTLYLYFADLGELILGALQPVIEDMDSFMRLLEQRWPDEQIEDHAHRFLAAHFDYWARHTHILHLRNSFADANDLRFLALRMDITSPIITALVHQMDGASEPDAQPMTLATAIVLLTGIERVATVTTASNMSYLTRHASRDSYRALVPDTIMAHARILALSIADQRRANGLGF